MGKQCHHDVDKWLAMLHNCTQVRRVEPTNGCASQENVDGTESRKWRGKPRSWLDTASLPPKEDVRRPVASTARRGGARRRSHGWTTGKRRWRTPSPELEVDAVEEEVEEYLRWKWSPEDDHVD